jgi:hypothetical protein
MNTLFILWLSYALVGWKLFWGDSICYVVLLISMAVILLSLRDEPWIQGVFGYVPQALTVILILSLLLTFVIAFPTTIDLVVLPALSTRLAWQDLEGAAYNRPIARLKSRLWKVGGTALLGLLFGEIISLYFLPGGSLS